MKASKIQVPDITELGANGTLTVELLTIGLAFPQRIRSATLRRCTLVKMATNTSVASTATLSQSAQLDLKP